jgi:hypothetical protein
MIQETIALKWIIKVAAGGPEIPGPDYLQSPGFSVSLFLFFVLHFMNMRFHSLLGGIPVGWGTSPLS